MIGPADLLTALLGVLGLAGGGAGWLARRDNKHKQELEKQLEATDEKVEELDTAFAQVATRLFGHPADASDEGVLTERGQRFDQAEGDIDSLSEEVRCIAEQAEENGETIDELHQRVSDHAEVTHDALARIEEQLETDIDLPERAEGD